MEEAFGVGASRGEQARQVSEFQQQNAQADAAIQMEAALRGFVAEVVGSDGVSPDALKSLEKVV